MLFLPGVQCGQCGQSPQQQCGEPPGWSSPQQTEEGRGSAGGGKDNTGLESSSVILR